MTRTAEVARSVGIAAHDHLFVGKGHTSLKAFKLI
jgi:hypothetical protein